ncbi:MAG: hypothetical protein ABWY06_06280 [Pseudomonas sp.]|uniref:hypothetical protein n=1 Tax=Pseudomonas sp. TaxID=306 RepID=UPI00339296B1
MKNAHSIGVTLALLHQNQVALSESVQFISAWLQRQGLVEVAEAVQPHIRMVVANCVQIDARLTSLLSACEEPEPG